MKLEKRFQKYVIKNTSTEIVVSNDILQDRQAYKDLSQLLLGLGFYNQPTFINPAVMRWYK